MSVESLSSAIIKTEQGALRGALDPETGLYGFFGIPYAEPPLGELRFRPPVSHRGWTGVLDASRFGSASAQLFDETEGEFSEFSDGSPVEGQPWVGSEDCLTLNIWAPAKEADSPRAVIVWIHGGANWLESSRLRCYHGDVLASVGDAIFVSINYRLGVFGFLDVSVLGGERYAGAHSHGLLDQLQALSWIKKNIARFGGDTANITVMGESAGSIDISWLLAGGHLRGLVKRAVMMSGYAGVPGAGADMRAGFLDASAAPAARQFFTDCGIQSFDQLNGMTTGEVMMKVHTLSESSDMLFHMDSLFWPKTGPHSSALDPMTFASEGPSTEVELVIGFTNYEMGLWLNWDDGLDQVGLDQMIKRLEVIPPSLQAEVRGLYEREFPDESDGQRAMHLLGDCIFVMPSLRAAEGLIKNNPVKLYRFDQETDSRRRAQHAADQIYFFGKLDTYAGKLLTGIPKDESDKHQRESLARLMQDIILGFAGAGVPGPEICSEWQQYNLESRSILSLNSQPEILHDPYKVRREWWFQNIYDPAAV